MSIYARDFLLILALLNGFGCCLFGAESRREAVLRQLTDSRAKYTTPEAWAERRIEVREGFLQGAGLWPLLRLGRSGCLGVRNRSEESGSEDNR